MEISTFIDKANIHVGLSVSSKKQLLSDLAELASLGVGIEERDIFDTLLQRERLGSTGVGYGVAIPHGKLRQIDAVFGVMATLKTPIDFDTVDGQPVDVVFLLLAPESAGADHLKALARISRLVRLPEIMDEVRACRSAGEIYSLLSKAEPRDAA